MCNCPILALVFLRLGDAWGDFPFPDRESLRDYRKALISLLGTPVILGLLIDSP